MTYATKQTISGKSNHLQSDDWVQNHHGGKWEYVLIRLLWIFCLIASRASSRNCRHTRATWGRALWCTRRSSELIAPAYGSTAALTISSWNQTDPLQTFYGTFYSVSPNALTSVTCNQCEFASCGSYEHSWGGRGASTHWIKTCRSKHVDNKGDVTTH